PGERATEGRRAAGRALHARPARPWGQRGYTRGLRMGGLGALRSGGKPPARPEGAAVDAARAELRRVIGDCNWRPERRPGFGRIDDYEIQHFYRRIDGRRHDDRRPPGGAAGATTAGATTATTASP